MGDKLVKVDHLRMEAERSAGMASQVAAAAAAAIEELDSKKQDRLPAGSIVLWSGSTAPTGWAFCDGTNGRPDLPDQSASVKYIIKL